MTVPPTIHRQQQQAAERRASSSTGRTRARRLHPEALAGAVRMLLGIVGVAVALGFAVLLLVLLGHHALRASSEAGNQPSDRGQRRPCSPSSAPGSAPACRGGAYPTLAHLAPRQLLYGDGIGDVRFGQRAASVDAALARLFGPTGAKHVVGICGSVDHYSMWSGLDVRPPGVRTAHRYFSAQLAVLFSRSRFAGYEYNNDQYIARGAPWGENSYPLGSLQAWQVLHGPPLTLATAKGLVLGDTVARARRLDGQAFRETTRGRLPAWEVSTPSGRIGGGIYTATQLGSFYASSQPGIATIGAGASCF